MIKRNILLSVVLSLIIIVTFSNIQAVDKKAESKKYPDKPEEVLQVAFDHMQNGEFEKGVEYYHPDLIVRESAVSWRRLRNASPTNGFFGLINFSDIKGFVFKDGRLVKMEPMEQFLIEKHAWRDVHNSMMKETGVNTNLYGETVIIDAKFENDTIAKVYYNITDDFYAQMGDTASHTATLKILDGKWKVLYENDAEEERVHRENFDKRFEK